MPKGDRIRTDGGSGLTQSPFSALDSLRPPPAKQPAPPTHAPSSPAPEPKSVSSARSSASPKPAKASRGRVDIRRNTAGRGGKTVTVIDGFVGISSDEKLRLAKAIQKAAASGGTLKEGRIEIQGDKREIAAQVLAEAGFRPVLAGG